MAVILGTTGVGTDGNDFEAVGTQIASKYTASATGVVDTVSLRIHTGNTCNLLRCAIFSDNAGTPNARIGNQVNMTVPTTGLPQWATSATGINASITSGTVYWIVFLSPTGGNQILFRLNDTTTSGGTKDTATGLSNIQTPWGALPTGSFTELMNAYAETAAFVADNTTKPGLPGQFTPMLTPKAWF